MPIKEKNIHRLIQCCEPSVHCWPMASPLISMYKHINIGDDRNDKISVKQNHNPWLKCSTNVLRKHTLGCLQHRWQIFQKSSEGQLLVVIVKQGIQTFVSVYFDSHLRKQLCGLAWTPPKRKTILSNLSRFLYSLPTSYIFYLIMCFSFSSKFYYPPCPTDICTKQNGILAYRFLKTFLK